MKEIEESNVIINTEKFDYVAEIKVKYEKIAKVTFTALTNCNKRMVMRTFNKIVS